GMWLDFHFDHAQRLEILLTLLQSGLGLMVLANMEFDASDAGVLFLLWLAQFLRPTLRDEVAIAYAVWMAFLVVEFALGRKALLAPRYFWETLRMASAFPTRGPDIGHSIWVHDRACWLNNSSPRPW